jgi:hypothetical protein
MSRTSRGVALTWPVSMRETLESEHSRAAATCSIVSPACSRMRRSSIPNRRRCIVGLRRVATGMTGTMEAEPGQLRT